MSSLESLSKHYRRHTAGSQSREKPSRYIPHGLLLAPHRSWGSQLLDSLHRHHIASPPPHPIHLAEIGWQGIQAASVFILACGHQLETIFCIEHASTNHYHSFLRYLNASVIYTMGKLFRQIMENNGTGRLE